MKKITYSQIQAFMRCPFSMKLGAMGFKNESPALSVGSEIHKKLERYFEHLHDSYSSPMGKSRLIYFPEYAKRFDNDPNVIELVETEKPFESLLAPETGLVLQGRADGWCSVNGKRFLLEHKTYDVKADANTPKINWTSRAELLSIDLQVALYLGAEAFNAEPPAGCIYSFIAQPYQDDMSEEYIKPGRIERALILLGSYRYTEEETAIADLVGAKYRIKMDPGFLHEARSLAIYIADQIEGCYYRETFPRYTCNCHKWGESCGFLNSCKLSTVGARMEEHERDVLKKIIKSIKLAGKYRKSFAQDVSALTGIPLSSASLFVLAALGEYEPQPGDKIPYKELLDVDD